MKKRILSLALALTLLASMALPASAASVSMSRCWNDIYYATNDACYARRFSCTIESDSASYTLSTDVYAYAQGAEGEVLMARYWGTPATMVATNNCTVDYTLFRIMCYHRVGTAQASTQSVYAT